MANVGFHLKDVVVNQWGALEDKVGEEQSRGSRGSWQSGKSLADEDESESESATDSEDLMH